MRRIQKLLFLASIGFGSFASASTKYFVSTKGDDKNDGQCESAAWKTAAKVNASKFSPGDQILFQRGGEWHESLIASSDGDTSNPITYADYGDANAIRPTFWGSDVVPPSAITLEHDSVYSFPPQRCRMRGSIMFSPITIFSLPQPMAVTSSPARFASSEPT